MNRFEQILNNPASEGLLTEKPEVVEPKTLPPKNRFERILSNPLPEEKVAISRASAKASEATARVVNNKIDIIALDQTTQEQYWRSVLTNAYFLRFPIGVGKFELIRELYDILEKLHGAGAGLARVEEQPRMGRRGRVARLKLEQGGVPDAEWARIRAEELPKHKDQLRWLFTLSVMGAAKEYIDLAAELPAEWVGDVLGKHGSRIAEMREQIIVEMIGKDRRSGLCFKVDDEKIYRLVPCKTGHRMSGGLTATELTPEEAVIVAEAQDAGLLPGGVEGAQSALRWVR